MNSNKIFVLPKKYFCYILAKMMKMSPWQRHGDMQAQYYSPARTALMASTAAAEPFLGYSSKAIIWS